MGKYKYPEVKVGDRVWLEDDVELPIEVVVGTVVRVYSDGRYSSELIDVQFDRRPERIVYGHFVSSVKKVKRLV